MGLDMVDLGYRIEKEFNVFIADEDYEHLKTVGDLKRYIEDHSTSVWPCPHIPAFSKLQAGLVNIANCSEDEIRLDTPLSNFSVPNDRIAFWKQLEDETGLKLQPLQASPVFTLMGYLLALSYFCNLLLILLGVIENIYAVIISYTLLYMVVTFRMPIILRPIHHFILRCSERYSWTTPVFPVQNIRELTQSVASMNRPQLVTPVSSHYPEIWPRLVELIVDTIGVEEDEVTPEAKFTEDFCC